MNINNIINTQTNFINQEINDDVVYNNQIVSVTGDSIGILDNTYTNVWGTSVTSKLDNKALVFNELVNNGSITNQTAFYGERRLEMGTWWPDTGDQPIQATSALITNEYLQTQTFDEIGTVVAMSQLRGQSFAGPSSAFLYSDTLKFTDMEGTQQLSVSTWNGIVSNHPNPFNFTTQHGLSLNNGVSTEGQVLTADALGNPIWADGGGGGGWVDTATSSLDMATFDITNTGEIACTNITPTTITDDATLVGTAGQILTSTGTGIQWADGGGEWVGTATSNLDMDTYAIQGLLTTDVPRSYNLDGAGIQFYNNDTLDNISITSTAFDINRVDNSTGQTVAFSRFQANDTACVNYDDPLNATQCVISSFGIVNSKVVNGEFFPNTSHYSKDDMHLSDGTETLDVTGSLLTFNNGVDSDIDITATGLIVTDLVHASSIEIKGLPENAESGLQTSLSPYTLNFSDGDGIKTRYRKDGIQTYNGGTFDISTVAGLTLQNASGTAGQVIVSDASSNPSWGTAVSTWVSTADTPLDMATFQINNSGDITCSAIAPVLIYDDTTVEGTNGQILASTGTGIRWIDNDIPDPIVSTIQYFISATNPGFQYPPIQPTSTIINTYQYYGWYFINAVAGRKIDWYFPPSNNMIVSDILGLYMNFFNITTTDPQALPFINVYTKPTGVNDALPFFAHSVMTYSLYDGLPINPFLPVANTPYCAFMNKSGDQPDPFVYQHTIQNMLISPVPNNPRGDYLPTEEVAYISVGSNSTSSVNQVNFVMSKVGICLASGNQEMILNSTELSTASTWVNTATSSLNMNAFNITSSSELSVGNTGVITNLIGNVNIPATLRYNTTQLIFGGTAITSIPLISANASVDWTGVNMDYVYWVLALSSSAWTLTLPITNLIVGQRITVRNESRQYTFLVSATATGLIYKTAITPISTTTMSLYFVNTFQCVDNSINPRWICLSAT